MSKERVIEGQQDSLSVLKAARSIATIGAKGPGEGAAHDVPAYLRERGYEVYAVSPKLSGDLFGHPVSRTVDEVSAPIDLVQIFRRAEAIPDHVAEILVMDPRPSYVWLQVGIRHDEAAQRLASEGITVVQDRCMMADHQTMARDRGAPSV